MRCDHCQTLLLDSLFGLLEPAELAAVELHVTGCNECALVRDQAARDHGLIVRAAKFAFPRLQFVAPEADPAPSHSHTTPAPSTPTARPSRWATWVSWAIVASLLAAVPGTLIPTWSVSGQYEHAQRQANDAARRVAELRANIEQARADVVTKTQAADDADAAARRRTETLLAEWVAAETAADRATKDRDVTVAVTKPLTLQPGAPNDIVVAVQSRGDALAGRQIEAEVRDQTGAVVFTQPVATQPPPVRSPANTATKVAPEPKLSLSRAAVRIPTDVWAKVTPQTELFLTVAAVDTKTGTRTMLDEPTQLFGPVYATMLVTDKSTYRPGESVHFRSLTLDRATFRPPGREQVLRYRLEKADGTPAIVQPDGKPASDGYVIGSTSLVRVAGGQVETERGPDGRPVRGVGCGTIALPPQLADGDYLLTLDEYPGQDGSPPVLPCKVTRPVKVRSGAPERYTKTITFDAGSYEPDAKIIAYAEIRSGGKPIAGATAQVAVTIDGRPADIVVKVTPRIVGRDGKTFSSTTNENGRITIEIAASPKPKSNRSDVRVRVTFRTPDAEESVAAQVPIAGSDVVVEFFPEGGKLVAGLPCRVYVRGTTPSGLPVDVRGEVTDGTATVALVTSPADPTQPGTNRGLGSFTFTPKAGANYRLKLEGGRGTEEGYKLPAAAESGVVMTVEGPATAPDQPIRVRLATAGKARELVVGAYTRGRLVGSQTVTVEPGKPFDLALATTADPRGGVTRVTVFEKLATHLLPVAERLVFRKPGESLNLFLEPRAGDAPLAPGSKVELSVTAQDEKGNPVAAILWAAAVNTAVAPGTKDRSVPTHFLLAGEIQSPDDLEYADFLLTDHPKAAVTLDHVLATQGWRRFVEQTGLAGLIKSTLRNPDGERLLVMSGAIPIRAGSAPIREHRRLFDAYWPRYDAALKEVEAARRAKIAAVPDQNAEAQARQLVAQYATHRQELTELAAAANSATERITWLRNVEGIAACSLGLLAAGLWVVAIGWTRGPNQGGGRLLVAAVLAGVLAAILALDTTNPAVANPINPNDEPELILPLFPTAPAAAPQVAPKAPNNSLRTDPSVDSFEALVREIDEIRLLSTRPQNTPPVKEGVTPSSLSVPRIALPGRPYFESDIPSHLFRPQGPKGPQRAIAATQPATDPPSVSQLAEEIRGREAEVAAQIKAALQAVNPGLSPELLAKSPLHSVVPWASPLLVREYAAPRLGPAPGQQPAETDTILWQPLIVLPSDGKTTLTFHTGTAPAGYQVVIAGHTLDGRLGTAQRVLPAAPAVLNPPNMPK